MSSLFLNNLIIFLSCSYIIGEFEFIIFKKKTVFQSIIKGALAIILFWIDIFLWRCVCVGTYSACNSFTFQTVAPSGAAWYYISACSVSMGPQCFPNQLHELHAKHYYAQMVQYKHGVWNESIMPSLTCCV